MASTRSNLKNHGLFPFAMDALYRLLFSKPGKVRMSLLDKLLSLSVPELTVSPLKAPTLVMAVLIPACTPRITSTERLIRVY